MNTEGDIDLHPLDFRMYALLRDIDKFCVDNYIENTQFGRDTLQLGLVELLETPRKVYRSGRYLVTSKYSISSLGLKHKLTQEQQLMQDRLLTKVINYELNGYQGRFKIDIGKAILLTGYRQQPIEDALDDIRDLFVSGGHKADISDVARDVYKHQSVVISILQNLCREKDVYEPSK